MLSRLVLASGLACSLNAAEASPWDRFFNKPAVSSAQYGINRAGLKAFTSAFAPLVPPTKRDKSLPVFPQLLPPPMAMIQQATDRTCAIPLLEMKPAKNKQFFIQRAPAPAVNDAGLADAPFIPACK